MRGSVQRTALFLASHIALAQCRDYWRCSMFSLRPAKWVLSSALIVALAAYGLDCLGMTTPEQAMQCCNTMRCHSHHHRGHHGSQDCCNTTPQIHADFGQPASVQAIAFSPVALGVVQAISDSQIMEFSGSILVGHSHDPPLSCSTPVISLRI
jgi:hypothetical protein